MITPFEIAQVVGKVFIYLATSSLVGTLFINCLERGFRVFSVPVSRWHARFLTSTLVLGIFGTVTYFFAQVGVFAEGGWGGMLDKLYLQLIWESGVGDASLFRVVSFCIALIATVLCYKVNNSKVIFSALRYCC